MDSARRIVMARVWFLRGIHGFLKTSLMKIQIAGPTAIERVRSYRGHCGDLQRSPPRRACSSRREFAAIVQQEI
eukprot:5756740-Lingulodinium_polyedra.AAC.1